MDSASPRDLVKRGADAHGARLAVVTSGARLTYRELAERTAAVAAALKPAGIGPGVQVALNYPNSIAYLVWHFAVLEAGGISASLSPTMTAEETGDLLERGGIQFLVTARDASLPGELNMSQVADAGSAEGACLWRTPQAFPPIATTPWMADGYLVRQFSSGSTGRPKHMLKTEAGITHHFRQFCDTLDLDENENFLAVAPFGHAFATINYNAAFSLGACVTLVPRFLPAAVLEAARRDPPTIFTATPPMIEALGSCLLQDGDEMAFRSLKACVCGTVRMAKDVHDAFEARFGVPVTFMYGSTESMTATIDLDEGYEEGRVGRPFAGVTVKIFDDDGNACPAGTRGLIGISSPAACREFVGDPESTARTFRDGYVFPGDVGYIDDLGRLHVLGRSDIINIGGYKVDRLEVEAVIRHSLPVKHVIVMEAERAGLPVVRAVVEADPDCVTRSMVIDACRARLSPHKVPTLVEVREQLERDANGKVLLAAIDR